MHDESWKDEQAISRRGFIKGAAITALTAGTVGAGAASLMNQQGAQTAVSQAPIIQSAPVAAAPAANTTNAELIGQLAQAHADNTRLQTQLSALQQRLDVLQGNNTSEKLTTESLTVQLDHANEQLGIFAGLVALYEQLDGVKVGDLLENGLTAVSSSITNLLDDLPDLEEGIQLGQVALDDFEAQLPLLENGRLWLKQHVDQLRQRYGAIEAILAATVERAGDFLEMLQTWFASVRKWLPFNMGERAANVMETITALVMEAPHTVNGMVTNLSEPLDILLAKEAGQEHPVQSKLVRPIREQVLTKGNTAVAKARNLNDAYTAELAEPVKTAVAQQQQIKQLIVEYRQQHSL